MTAGSILATLGVLGWAAASSVGAFYVVWIAIGAAMALVLYEPAQVVLVKQFGAHATRAITTLTLVAGFASTIFQPVTAILADRLGWRTSLVVLAVALAAITIPIHARRPAPPEPAGSHTADRCARTRRDATEPGRRAADRRLHPGHGDDGGGHRPPHPVPRRPRLEPVLAAVAAGTLGATQVAARLAFGPTARRTSSANLAAGILGLPAVAIVVLALSDGSWTAWIAVALLGAAQGTATLLRPMLLSRLNGPDGYGRLAATSAATTTIARATAPLSSPPSPPPSATGRLHPVRPASVPPPCSRPAPSHRTRAVDTEHSLSSS